MLVVDHRLWLMQLVFADECYVETLEDHQLVAVVAVACVFAVACVAVACVIFAARVVSSHILISVFVNRNLIDLEIVAKFDVVPNRVVREQDQLVA